ncbi:MAG TPA: regulatory protein RecX [Gemmatimonadaceae bacterium]|nr:regulatory protein RecX [Gemmatimonadaceae bacterium]
MDRGGGPESSKSSSFSTRFFLSHRIPYPSSAPCIVPKFRIPLPHRHVSTYNKALECLARGPKSVKDLTRWLLQRDFPRDEVEAAIERLTARGLLNDAAYAEMFARSRATTRGMSRRRISAELAKRGVARDLADAAINEVMCDESIDELAMVQSAAAKKFRSLAKLDPQVQRTRLYGFLARKGYPPDLVRITVAKLTRATPLLVALFLAAFATVSAQQTSPPPAAGESEHRAVLELGFAAERGIGESSAAAGGTIAMETTPIENWLELEAGLTLLHSSGHTEFSGDFLVKKPWQLTQKAEFMIGVGPEFTHHSADAEKSSTTVAAEFVSDFMYWPSPNVGWYLEPSYSVSRISGGDRSVGISAGLIIGIP